VINQQVPHLIFLIGLPGSGKSTLAMALLQQCPQRRLVSTDAIRAALFGDAAVQGPWLKVWQAVEQQFTETVAQIQQGEVREGVFDATNVVRRQRRLAIALARRCGFTQITGLWMDTPLELCLARNQGRDRRVPEEIIQSMHRCLWGAPPSLADDLDELLILQPK